MCNVYRRFVKNFARTARPLTRLTSNQLPMNLGPLSSEQMASFESLESSLLTPAILTILRARGTFVIDVDACDTQIGCALLQSAEPIAEEEASLPDLHPVGFFSRTLTPAEQNYSATERECLGVVWAIQPLRPYLERSKFIVRSDHEPLRWLLNLGDTDSDGHGRLAR